MELVSYFISNYGMAGFIASLAADNDIGGFAKDVDEFPFALYYNFSVAREENAQESSIY
jgi:hypothetical protein